MPPSLGAYKINSLYPLHAHAPSSTYCLLLINNPSLSLRLSWKDSCLCLGGLFLPKAWHNRIENDTLLRVFGGPMRNLQAVSVLNSQL